MPVLIFYGLLFAYIFLAFLRTIEQYVEARSAYKQTGSEEDKWMMAAYADDIRFGARLLAILALIIAVYFYSGVHAEFMN